MTAVVKVKVITESYSATELQGPGRHLSGNKNYPSDESGKRVSANKPLYQLAGSG